MYMRCGLHISPDGQERPSWAPICSGWLWSREVLSLLPSARAQWSLRLTAVAGQLLASWVSGTTVIKRWDGLVLSSRSQQTAAASRLPILPLASGTRLVSNKHSVYIAGQRKTGQNRQTAQASSTPHNPQFSFSVSQSSRCCHKPSTLIQ